MLAVKSTARVIIVSNVKGKVRPTIGLDVFRGFSSIALVIALCFTQVVNKPALAQGRQGSMHWVGTWGTPPQAQGSTGANAGSFNNQTLRMVMRASLGGHQVRVRLSNTFG